MWEFADRLITIVLPRIRDFRGVKDKLDGRGNYTLGLSEQTVFPEIDFDKIEFVAGHGHHVRDHGGERRAGLLLLKELGMPFRRGARQQRKREKKKRRGEVRAMAKTSAWIVKCKRPPKFKTRGYTALPICGRSRAVYRKFGICRICLRDAALRGEIPACARRPGEERLAMMTDPIADMLHAHPQRQLAAPASA